MATSAGEAGEHKSDGASAALPIAEMIGRTINGRFEISSFIAKGGMGSVYKGRQLPLGRVCAVKVLLPSLRADERTDFHHRFFLEASTAAKLTHPNTVTIYDYGRTDDDVYYMAMEFLDGRTLRDAIVKEAPFTEERALHVARQICRSLREAHAMDVIHRDLKPANIFLVEHGDESDVVKVLDFGLVKNIAEAPEDQHTQAGICMGSPKYMAPEQITGAHVDARTDIYALGILLYEMLTGRVPFDRGNGMSTIMAHVSEEVPPMRVMRPDLALSADVERVVMRCLSKAADDRFNSMDDVLNALKITSGTSSTMSNEYARSGSGGSAQLDAGLGTASLPLPALSATHDHLMAAVPPRRGRGIVIGGAIAAVAAVLMITVATRSSSKPAEASTQTTSAAAATPPAANAAAAVVTTATSETAAREPGRGTKIGIVTEPSGAAVKEDGVEIRANTPCDVRYDGADAVATKDHKLLVSLPGYKVESKVVHAGDGNVSLALTRAPMMAAPAAPAARPKQADVPGGYKADIPY